ncbi:hypothetical protein SD70_14050 [Gordoniibacillus kamchatkensis]|uniref:Uncharacterized protein n=1 Tax=Gordoniibacillus kamchatkensis TaxID=1590651 RepID=A0ABR5AH54_9BACL|nr:hypothetical protein [Paenibacillus sp. VKM B-2647]KIL40359.1 hypothetical protein SD70_14050 [Paenibacillus sp. VKM B-2647]
MMADQIDAVLCGIEAIMQSPRLPAAAVECAQATQLMARRMKEVIWAGIYYNRFLEAREDGITDAELLRRLAEKAIFHAEEDYRLIKENYFDSGDHTWTGVAIGEYYIPQVINEYKNVFHPVVGAGFEPDPAVSRIVGGESLPWEWLLEWGPRIAKAKPTAAIRK